MKVNWVTRWKIKSITQTQLVYVHRRPLNNVVGRKTSTTFSAFNRIKNTARWETSVFARGSPGYCFLIYDIARLLSCTKNHLFVYSRSWKRDFFFLKKFSASCTKFRCFHVGSFTCSSSFSMAAARITSGPLQCLIKKLSPIQSWDQTDPYLTAYSMVLMHGLIFSIWRHFPLAPNDDIFLGELILLMHWIGDTVEDRHKWRLSQLVRMIWSRVAICKVSGEIFE